MIINTNYPQTKERFRVRMTSAAKAAARDRKAWCQEVGFPNYSAYLRGALWHGISRKVLALHPDCEYCGKPATRCHHSSYWPAVLRGEDLRPIHPVCAGCHRYGHRSGAKGSALVSPRQATERLLDRREWLQGRAVPLKPMRSKWKNSSEVPESKWQKMSWQHRARMIAWELDVVRRFNRIIRSRLKTEQKRRLCVQLLGNRFLIVDGKRGVPWSEEIRETLIDDAPEHEEASFYGPLRHELVAEAAQAGEDVSGGATELLLKAGHLVRTFLRTQGESFTSAPSPLRTSDTMVCCSG